MSIRKFACGLVCLAAFAVSFAAQAADEKGCWARVRFQNRKQYRYFTCPKCHAWLRLPRNVGEVTEGSWEGRKAIGASIAYDSDGTMVCMLPYGVDQECVHVVEVEVRDLPRSGTELAVYAYDCLKARGGGA